MPSVILEDVAKRFGSTPVVTGFDLKVADGEAVALLGPSGCGKTTVLRMIAGLEVPDRGRIAVGERVASDAATGAWIPPERRRVGMVFQSYAVWPHMDVLQNVAYPLRVRGVGRAERRRRVLAMLEQVGLTGLEARRPSQLSGGQQQRVALARGLVMEPDVLLLDEPLSNLDAKLRVRMRRDIRALQRRIGLTVVYVTHDQVEAAAVADRLVVMEGGRISGVGTAAELADHPFLAPHGAEEAAADDGEIAS